MRIDVTTRMDMNIHSQLKIKPEVYHRYKSNPCTTVVPKEMWGKIKINHNYEAKTPT